MWFLDLFKPAPYVEPISDAKKVKIEYQYWRIRIFYSMFIGYAFYYFTRKSFTFAMPGMIQDLGFTKSELGLVGTVLAISYGCSKLVTGVLADHSNPRYILPIGLIVTGVLNILFGISSSLFFLAIFWGLNGWFQGFGWAPCARLLTHWYSQKERGSWWSCWNVSHNIGGALIPLIVAACSYYLGWRYALYIPGFLCISMGLFLINRLRDTPQSLGLPPIEVYNDDYGGATMQKGDKVEKDYTAKELLLKYVLKNPYIWLLAAANFFVYVVRTAVNDWSALYLVEMRDYSQITANTCVSLFEIGGFAGSLTAGWASDKIFAARRGPVNAVFAFGMLLATLLFWFSPVGKPFLDSLVMFLIGFTVFGPQMLIGIAAAELSHKKAAATATGFTGWFAYIGAAVAGYPLGKIAQDWGWEGFFWTITICCSVAFVTLFYLWTSQAEQTGEEATEAALEPESTA